MIVIYYYYYFNHTSLGSALQWLVTLQVLWSHKSEKVSKQKEGNFQKVDSGAPANEQKSTKKSFLQQKTEINKSQIIISYAEHAVKSLVTQKNSQVISFLQHLKIQMCVGCVKNLWMKLAVLGNSVVLTLKFFFVRNATSNSVIIITLNYILSFTLEKESMNVTRATENSLGSVISRIILLNNFYIKKEGTSNKLFECSTANL